MSDDGAAGGDAKKLRRAMRALAALRAKPVAFRPLPYGHPLGPTGTLPITFGHVGGGNQSGAAGGTLATWHQDERPRNRYFDRLRRQYRRIRANGGKRRPVGRPRVGDVVERRIHQLLAEGRSVKSIAATLGISRSVVQRIQNGG